MCEPADDRFQAWLGGIPYRRGTGVKCKPPTGDKGEAHAYLVQAVQSHANPVPLVAGERGLLRVFVTAVSETTVGMPAVRARFYLDGAERHVVDIPGGSTPIPTELDEGDLGKSANAEIPGPILKPGLEMVIEVDPESTLDPALGVVERIPATGRLQIEVHEMPALDLTVIPILWSTNPDSTVLEVVNGMAADPEHHRLLEDTRILLPVGQLDVTAHQPLVTARGGTAFDILPKVEAIRVLEGGSGHYLGLVPVREYGGVAYMPGRSSLAGTHAGTIAHELGHNMSLMHAPCGGAVGETSDPLYPYEVGSIGAWGYDFRSGRLVLKWRKDLMSYCSPQWISDYHFTKALWYRLSAEDPAKTLDPALARSVDVRSLLLWGGVDRDGRPFLNPTFVANAPATLPESPGDHRVIGRDADGGELFSLSFAMSVMLSEEKVGSAFVYALPARTEWAEALASITLIGPNGSVTLNGESDRPMVILRNPLTGQVRGFLSDLPQAAQAAMGEAGRVAGPSMEVLFSRGIPELSAWRP